MNEDEMRQIFREMRDEPVPVDSLARVRAGVDRRVQKRSWLFGWKIAAALVMAGCIVGAFLLLRPGKPVDQVSPPEIAQVLPPVEIPALPEIPVRRAPRPKRARPRPVVEGVPVSIRIETPDPDVVILLVN
jgi:anti-sigma factor RsiW